MPVMTRSAQLVIRRPHPSRRRSLVIIQGPTPISKLVPGFLARRRIPVMLRGCIRLLYNAASGTTVSFEIRTVIQSTGKSLTKVISTTYFQPMIRTRSIYMGVY